MSTDTTRVDILRGIMDGLMIAHEALQGTDYASMLPVNIGERCAMAIEQLKRERAIAEGERKQDEQNRKQLAERAAALEAQAHQLAAKLSQAQSGLLCAERERDDARRSADLLLQEQKAIYAKQAKWDDVGRYEGQIAVRGPLTLRWYIDTPGRPGYAWHVSYSQGIINVPNIRLEGGLVAEPWEAKHAAWVVLHRLSCAIIGLGDPGDGVICKCGVERFNGSRATSKSLAGAGGGC